jgi:hypothetical protein
VADQGESIQRRGQQDFEPVIFTVIVGATAAPIRALAEFEIQETQVEKGEVEIDYRDAVHFGFPRAERQAAKGSEGEPPSRRKKKANSSVNVTILSPSLVLPSVGCSQSLLAPTSRSITISM